FIAGIRGVTTGVSNAIPVVIDSNGQLGTAAETDPKVGTLGASGRACTSTGTQVACTGAALTTTQVNYSAPRTGYLHINAAAFVPASATTGAGYSGWARFISSSSILTEYLVASLSLPQGSTLTGFACMVEDNDATPLVDISVNVVDGVSNFQYCSISAATLGAPGQVTISGACNL